MWLAESRLDALVQVNLDRISHAEDVHHIAVMPDVHLGHSVNNGTVVATEYLIYPQAVGGDIGCGIAAIRFSAARLFDSDQQAHWIIRELYRRVPALKQHESRNLPERLNQLQLTNDSLIKKSQREGAYQLGTLGCGNHFAEFQEDETGCSWFMVHTGSRAMGQFITEHHLATAATSATGLKYLDSRSHQGQAYLQDMEWAKQYATLNRLAIIAEVAEIMEDHFSINVDEDSYLDCTHNFVRRETHFGREWWIHRKSAISAQPEELGIVAGSMGTPSFIVRGMGLAEALCSSSHGAGRVLSRTEARKTISQKSMEQQLGTVCYDDNHLRNLRDEAPGAYRDIHKVMRAQHELTRQVTRLTPKLNFKYPDRTKFP